MNKSLVVCTAGFVGMVVISAWWSPIRLHDRPPVHYLPTAPVRMPQPKDTLEPATVPDLAPRQYGISVTDPQPGTWVSDPIAPTGRQPDGTVIDRFSAEAMANIGVSFVPFCHETPDGSMLPDEDSVCVMQRTTAESADYWLHKTVFQQTMQQVVDRAAARLDALETQKGMSPRE